MVDSKQEEGNDVPENSLTAGPRCANEGKEGVIVDSAPLVVTPPPTVGDFPDGGLTAWLVVVGVCVLVVATSIHCAKTGRRPYRAHSLCFPRSSGVIPSFSLLISDLRSQVRVPQFMGSE